MASNQTEHYGLNLWEGTDCFQRTEFNEDNKKMDAALLEKCNQIDFLTLEAAVALKGRLAVGTYEGNGAAGRVINVGFTPKVLILTDRYGQTQQSNMVGYTYGGISITGHSSAGAIIVNGGFQVAIDERNKIYTNQASQGPYGYIALG